MSKEKQIEEIANVIYDDPNAYDTYWRSHCEQLAETIYNAGYRKQSEGRWIFKGTAYGCSLCGEGVIAPIDKYCRNCGARMKGERNES